MKSMTQEELELQKNRLEILKLTGKPEHMAMAQNTDDNVYLWQYELEHYKRSKKKDRFYIFGALCGILSLIVTVILNFSELLALFLKVIL